MEMSFDDASYSSFLDEKKVVNNSRLRGENETFFDAMLSEEADLRTTAEGREIIQHIQALGSE